MPTLTPGNDIVVIKPTLWWSPLYTKLPKMGMPLDQNWSVRVDPLWTKVQDTVNGIQITNRAPIVPIVSEERDRIGSVRAGGGGGGRGAGGGGAAAAAGAGTAIAFQMLTPTESSWLKANYMTKVTTAAAAEVVEFKFSTGATANGNITIGLGAIDGLTTTNSTVPVTSAAQATAAQVATAVAGTTITGWTLAVKSGTTDTVVATSVATGPRGPHTFGAAATGVTVTTGYPMVTVGGHYGIDGSYIDQDADHSIMVGFEGMVKAGSLFSTNKIIRGFGYRCENTQNGIDVWRRTGADAVIKPNLVLECIPADYTTLTSAMISGTGITTPLIDPDSKFNYFWTNKDAA